MSDQPEASAPHRNRGRIVFWSVFTALVATAVWLLFGPRHRSDIEGPSAAAPEFATQSTRPIVLYFADREAHSLVSERREVPGAATLEGRVEAALQALGAGPDQQGAVPALPTETRLKEAFFDEESSTLYLDFNAALVTHHPGGSAAEYYTLNAIVRTVGANFPEVSRLQILVDGQPIDSLAGHFDTSRPIDVRSWQ